MFFKKLDDHEKIRCRLIFGSLENISALKQATYMKERGW